jgi:hypothetical protein
MNIVLMLSLIEGKGFGFGGRGGGGGFKGGSQRFGTYARPSSYNRMNSYGSTMYRP